MLGAEFYDRLFATSTTTVIFTKINDNSRFAFVEAVTVHIIYNIHHEYSYSPTLGK